MGLKGRFTIPMSDLEVKNAYVSLYDTILTLQTLPDTALMRQIYEKKADPPPNFYEAGGYDGKYTLTGTVNVYATHEARKANKSKIGGYDVQIICRELDSPLTDIVYKWLKSKYPKLKDC